jgi:hypothetical protein
MRRWAYPLLNSLSMIQFQSLDHLITDFQPYLWLSIDAKTDIGPFPLLRSLRLEAHARSADFPAATCTPARHASACE